MKNWKNFIKNNWVAIFLIIIVIGSIFVRVYKFEDWLFFRADQVRDAKLATEAFEKGSGELPLLGPRAAGTFLRLGPAFYYMQYTSTVVFNSIEPHIFALPDLFFSILTIPLLFYFLRCFFFRRNALLITALYGFSFIIIQYSRFAWNPNSLAFWGLLFILSLYKSSQSQKKKEAGWWFLGMALAYAIASQLHFVALVGYPIIAFLFWIFYFPKKINWKYWLGAILIFLAFYIPVIVSDFQTNGDNFKQFVYAVTAKTGDEKNTLTENLRQISVTFSMFLTSYGHKDGVVSALIGAIVGFFGFGFLGYFWKTAKEKRPFVYLVFIWLTIFVGLLIKTNTSLKPRFFMPMASVPFIFWGLGYAFLDRFKKNFLTVLIFISFAIAILMNFGGMKIAYNYFSQQDKKVIPRHIFIKQDDAKVLEIHEKITRYMASKVQDTGKIACFNSSATYERTYEFLFKVYHPQIKYDRISKSFENKENCQYFSIVTAGNKKRISSHYKNYFEFNNSVVFGRLEVWNLTAKDKFIHYKESQDLTRKENRDPENKTNETIKDELKESVEDYIKKVQKDEIEIEKPDREPRVFWKDVFEKS